MTDLVDRYCAGDVSAVSDLIGMYRSKMRKKLHVLRRDRAIEEGDLLGAVQEGIVVALEAHKKKPCRNALASVYFSVRSCLRRLERGAQETVALDFEPCVDEEERMLIRVDLAMALDRLDGRRREVGKLVMDGVRTKDIAEILGCAANYVAQVKTVVLSNVMESLGGKTYLYDTA